MGINIIYYIFFDMKRSIKTEGRIPDAIAGVSFTAEVEFEFST